MFERRVLILAVTIGAVQASRAEAQQFSPLTIKPKPNHVVAVDASHEMAFNVAGTPNPGATGNRMADLRTAFLGTTSTTGVMGLFRDEFLWGGFAYSGARYAKIKDGSGTGFNNGTDTRWYPPAAQTPANISTSYANVRGMVGAQTPDYCVATKTSPSCAETYTPGGGTPACVTPTVGCSGDDEVFEAVFSNSAAFGMAFNVSAYVLGLDLSTTLNCDTGVAEGACTAGMSACFQAQPGTFPLDCRDATPGAAPTQIRPLCELVHELLYFAPPRFVSGFDGNDVRAQFCGTVGSPVNIAFANVNAKINACLTMPSSVDFSFSCNATALASNGSNSICGPMSPFQTGVSPCADCDMNADGECSTSDGECGGSACAGCDTNDVDGECQNSDNECDAVATCVCDQSDPLCSTAAPDDCGVNFTLYARQQVAMCFSHDNAAPSSAMYTALAAQADNVVNGAATDCRANVITYLTDGTGGNTTGVVGNAPRNGGGGSAAAPWGVYRTRVPDPDAAGPMLGLPQNYVLYRGPLTTTADFMQDRIQDAAAGDVSAAGATRTTATDPVANPGGARAIYARTINRNRRGTYSAANITVDRFETRAAFFIYEVPGGPTLARDADAAYLGRPSRIAFHQLEDGPDADTTPDRVGALLWETDWSTKAGVAATVINSNLLAADTAVGVAPVPGPADNRLGSAGTWVDGVTTKVRAIAAGTLDRNGDGVVGAAEQPQAVTWGHMLGGENAAPVIVEAPRDVPVGTDGPAFGQFQNLAVVRDRPRVIYAYTNGFIIGINGGANNGSGTSDRISIAQTYSDAAATAAGTELFRVRPSFIYAAGNPSALLVQNNEALQQPLMNGHMIAREVPMGGGTFSTLLVATQGSAGRGVIALDVTDPVVGGAALPAGGTAFNSSGDGPRVIWEVLLPDPSDRATSKPVIYTFPGNLSVVLMTGGANGTANLYALRADTGAVFSTQALTGGASYRTAPSCVDTEGRGVMRYCYLVRGDGRLERISIDQSTGLFNGVANITPGGASSPVGGSRQFWTEPVLTFGRDNTVNIFYASGNVNALSAPDGSTNRLYKVVDQIGAVATPGVLFGTSVCVASGVDTSGAISFANDDEMVVSPPTLAKGVLAVTTYRPATDGCTLGTARLYALNVETCADAGGGGGLRPAANDVGTGVPTSPTILRRSEGILTHTSAQPTGDLVSAPLAVSTRGGRRAPLMRGYWLPWRAVR